MSLLEDVKVALLLAKMHEESQFWYSVRRLKEAGVNVIIAAEEAGRKYKGRHGLPAKSDKAFAQIRVSDYDGVVIPGGSGPEFLCGSKACIRLVREMFETGRMVAFICRGGKVPASAGIIEGRRATSVTAVREDLKKAGCKWEDSACVVDGNLISSRDPDDLPDFMNSVIRYLESSRKEAVTMV